MDLRAEPGLTMTIYAAEPDSPTAHALNLLASWAATAHEIGSTPRRQLLASQAPVQRHAGPGNLIVVRGSETYAVRSPSHARGGDAVPPNARPGISI